MVFINKTESIFGTMNLIEAVYEAYKKNPDKAALVTAEREITYRELISGIISFSAELKARKIKKKSRILLETSDLTAFFIAFLSCMSYGTVAVPVEAEMSVYRLHEVINTTKPSLIFLQNNGEKYRDFLKEPMDAVLTAKQFPEGDSDAVIISTTGTTGNPSLILHTNSSIAAAAENLASGTEISEETVMLTNMPVYLSTGYLRVLAVLMHGGTVIVTDSPYDGELIRRASERYSVNRLSMVSTTLASLVQEYRDKNARFPDSVRQAESVASVLPGNAALDFHRLFPSVILYNVYGTTESGCILIHNTDDNYDSDCIGKPAVNADIVLLDENGKEITAPGSYGHVAVRGSMNMKCYYRKKALTEQVMKNGRIIINDIVYFDRDGFYHFVSRVGDIINVEGRKITPLEIEDAAFKIPGVQDCACTKRKDHVKGEVPVLYVVKDEGLSLDSIRDSLKEHLESYRIPSEIHEIEKIPRTATGKVMRHILGL